jgi:hypothetical protein
MAFGAGFKFADARFEPRTLLTDKSDQVAGNHQISRAHCVQVLRSTRRESKQQEIDYSAAKRDCDGRPKSGAAIDGDYREDEEHVGRAGGSFRDQDNRGGKKNVQRRSDQRKVPDGRPAAHREIETDAVQQM